MHLIKQGGLISQWIQHLGELAKEDRESRDGFLKILGPSCRIVEND